MLSQKRTDICATNWHHSCTFLFHNHRDIGKDKDKCDGGEDEDGKQQNTPRRKTANSQGRRKGRITTRSMANEAATVAAEETTPSAQESGVPDPPQLPRTDPAQKAMKDAAKTPLSALDTTKGDSSLFLLFCVNIVCNPKETLHYSNYKGF